jgi:phage terminase large subunit GpA-like protein
VLDASAVFSAGWSEGWEPPPVLLLSEWADEYRQLSRVSSSEPGQWRTERTPYLREPMDCLSPASPVEEVDMMFGTQLGKTETGNNWVGFTIDVDPGPMMVVQPTQKVGKKWTKQRFKPMRDSMPTLREKVRDPRSRESGNTADMKEFPGGILIIAGANSASDLRSTPIAKLYLDEIDNYPQDVDNEGDPVELAVERTANFPRRKILKTSSPTTRGSSRIESAFMDSDQCRYFVPCPHCNEPQSLEWKQLRWDDVKFDEAERTDDDDSGVKVDVGRAWYVCVHCGAEIEEHQKTWMLAHGGWVAKYPGRHGGRVRGFHLNSLYSPVGWKSWRDCAARFLKASKLAETGDTTKLKIFYNTVLAETWEERGDKVQAKALAERAAKDGKFKLREPPAGVLFLTAAVDVQGNRLELAVKGWGFFQESWSLDYVTFWGDPASDARVWQELDKYLLQPMRLTNGREMHISAVAVDSGGHATQQVYEFCRGRAHRRVIAIKGASRPGQPILGKPVDVEVNIRGERFKAGVKLWYVGTDTAKALIYGRLRLATPGAGFAHYSHELPLDYFEQLTCERLVTRYVKGRPKMEWLKPAGKRNEALDLDVYNEAAAHLLGLHRMKLADWERRAVELNPPQGDLLTAPPTAAPPAAVAQDPQPLRAARPKSNWVTGFKR